MSLYSWLRSWKSLRCNTQTILRRTAKPGKKPARFRPMLEVLEDRVTPSHFRYGTIDWAPAAGNPNQVNFHLTQAWRTDYPFGTIPTVGGHVSTGTFAFGDGSSANIDLTVKAINTSENWFIGEWTTTHTYSGTGNFIASMDSGARISTLKNNADGNYRTETRVNVGGAGSNNPFPGNASAVSSLPAIIQVPDNQVWKFQLPAIDQNGDNLTYRLATNSEAGYGSSSSGIVGQPTGFSISPTGLITWDVRDSVLNTSPGNLWTSQIMVEDHSPDGSVKSWVPVDFILQITDPQQVAPTVVASPTGPFQPTAFTTLSFNVTATAQTGFNITNLQALNAPAGMTFSTFGSPANTKTITATWTPTQAQANQTFVVTFQASDNHSPALTGTTSVTISPQAAFFSTTTTISASPVTYNADGAVTVKVSSSGGGTPTGNVLLSVDGGTPLTGTLDASGLATFILPTPDAGSRKLSASYAAQGSFLTKQARKNNCTERP